eukprot:gene25203-1660_t
MEFAVQSRDGSSRTGSVRCSNGTVVQTPAYAVETRRGGVPCLTPDVLQQIYPAESSILQASVWDVHEGPGVNILSKFNEANGKEHNQGTGLSAFYGVSFHSFYLHSTKTELWSLRRSGVVHRTLSYDSNANMVRESSSKNAMARYLERRTNLKTREIQMIVGKLPKPWRMGAHLVKSEVSSVVATR